MRTLRSFLFAPPSAEHARYVANLRRLIPRFPDAAVIESAYRHSGARQTAFAFAQGAVVGALGNLFASSLGHFVDRAPGAAWSTTDAWWSLLGVTSLAVIVTMTWGALRRYRQNTAVEDLFVAEVRRRGGIVDDEPDDPDAFAATR